MKAKQRNNITLTTAGWIVNNTTVVPYNER